MAWFKKTASCKWFPWSVLVLAGVVLALLAITSNRQLGSAMAESAFNSEMVQWPIDPENIGMPDQSYVEVLQFEDCLGFRLAHHQFLVSIQTDLDQWAESDQKAWEILVRMAVDEVAPEGIPLVEKGQVDRRMKEAIYEALKHESQMGVSVDDIVIKSLDSLDRSRGVEASSV